MDEICWDLKFRPPKYSFLDSQCRILAVESTPGPQKMLQRAPSGSPTSSKGAPELSQPPVQGVPPPPSGSPKTYVFIKERVEFPLSKVARNRHPGVHSLEHQCALSPRAPDTLKVHTFLIFAPPLAPTRRPALRGRRTDWPAATAADPEKMNARLRSLPPSTRFLKRLRSRLTSRRFSKQIAMPRSKS